VAKPLSALFPSTITDLEDCHLWPAPGHLNQSLQGFLITVSPRRSTTTLPLSPSTPQGGAFDTASTTRSVLLPENDPCTQHALQGCLPSCQTYTAVGLEISYFPERTRAFLWDNRVVHTGLPFGEQVFTHCSLSYSSQSSRIARGTCSPRPGLRSYFSSSVCSGHPMANGHGQRQTA
jgi:hypothetical protein